MPQTLTDTINLGASVVTILGAVSTTIGAVRRWRAGPKPPKPGPRTPPGRGTRTWPPPTVKQPVVRPETSRAPRSASHPVILWFAVVGLLAVSAYSIELLVNAVLSGGASTGVAAGSPLAALNAVLVALNLVCVTVACAGVLMTAFRNERWGWVAMGAVTLLVALVTIGILSVVALAPTLFYGLTGPREGDIRGY